MRSTNRLSRLLPGVRGLFCLAVDTTVRQMNLRFCALRYTTNSPKNGPVFNMPWMCNILPNKCQSKLDRTIESESGGGIGLTVISSVRHSPHVSPNKEAAPARCYIGRQAVLPTVVLNKEGVE
jgi:hypothetical protein